MNQEKIGKFIAQNRKEKKLTQEQLAEMLGISNRAVSKWERGLNLPDATFMLSLSSIFKVTVNEILNGEKIEEEKYRFKAEEALMLLKEKEEVANQKFLNLELVIGFCSSISFISLILIVIYIPMDKIGVLFLVLLALFLFITGLITAMKLEREAGYYECSKCHHKFIPSNRQMWFSVHLFRNRYLKCLKCHQMTWHKKVLSK